MAELCVVCSADALVAADPNTDRALDDAVGEEADQFRSWVEPDNDVGQAVFVTRHFLIHPFERVEIRLSSVIC